MKDDWNAICRSYTTDVVSSCNSSCNTRLLVFVVDTFAAEVRSSTLTGLEDDRAVLITGSFESGYHSRTGSDIDGWDSVVVLLGVVEQFQNVIANNAERDELLVPISVRFQ